MKAHRARPAGPEDFTIEPESALLSASIPARWVSFHPG
jgi:hypothetical protein